MKLPRREMPVVTFRRELPAFLAGGDPCFIYVEARAGGVINMAYVQAMEDLRMRAAILDKRREEVKDPAALIEARHADATAIAIARFAALFDACVIEWKTNMLDDGKPMACTRENFIALFEEKAVPELSTALLALEVEVLSAGKIVAAEQDATLKN